MAEPRCQNCGETRFDDEGRCVACREFPTLGYDVAQLIEQTCVVPDGDLMGQPYGLTDEMLRFLLWHYRVLPDAVFDRRAGVWRRFWAFPRGSQLVRPQKWGKGPFVSAHIVAEAHPDGPVLFDGWDADGRPVGRPWTTPHIQITAVSEDQTANVWRALQPMIELGALAADIPDTGRTRINLPGGGLIEPVTSSASSRLGQRVTFVPQDETHSWLKANGGHRLADNQRRNLAGMGGRFVETTNAWDPVEDSVAQRTSTQEGVYHDDVDPGAGSVRNKQHRRRMLKKVYGDSWWVDLDRIDTEIVSLLEHDPGQAERFFLNRKEAGESTAFDLTAWEACRRRKPHTVEDGSLIVIGVDGARFDDALAIVATEVDTGYQWPLDIIERPDDAKDDYEHDFDRADGAVSEAFERFYVWRLYADEQKIEHLVETWQGRWGDKRVLTWLTNRPRQMAWAVRQYTTAIAAGDLSHDGDPVLERHIRNARKRKVHVLDDKQRQMHVIAKDRHDSPRKIDGASAGVLSWEARGDAKADGAEPMEPFVSWASR